MADEFRLRDELCRWGRSLFERGLTPGSSGNFSARLADGSILVTPTNSCLGFLDPARLSRIDAGGALLSGEAPTKEVPLHLAFYRARPSTNAVVHLHSTFATALSCLAGGDRENAIAPITPYAAMRVGRVPLIPYVRPGSPVLGSLIAAQAPDHAAVLLANHGPVTSASSFEAAVFAAEELEATAKLLLLTRNLPTAPLSSEQLDELAELFGTP